MRSNFLLLPFLSLALAAQTPAPATQTPAPAAAAAPETPAQPEAAPKAATVAKLKPGAKTAVRKDTILAWVGGKPVMESDFLLFLDMAYNPQQRIQMGMVDGAMEQVQDQYLQTRLFEAKARKDGLDKDPAFSHKRALMETDLLARALFERDGEKLQGKLSVSDADVKAYYDKNPDQFKTPETFTARHILVSDKESSEPDAKTLTDEALKAKVAKVQEALKGGKKFEDVVKEFSDDPGSKEKGGLYEDIAFGSFVPEFEAAVRKQKAGEIGEPVKSQFGMHLIQVEKITPSALPSFETSKEKAQQLASQARQDQVMKDYVASLKQEIPFVVGPNPGKPAAAKKGKLPKPATPGSI